LQTKNALYLKKKNKIDTITTITKTVEKIIKSVLQGISFSFLGGMNKLNNSINKFFIIYYKSESMNLTLLYCRNLAVL